MAWRPLGALRTWLNRRPPALHQRQLAYHLAQLNHTVDRLQDSADSDTLLTEFCRAAADLLHADGAALFLPQGAGGTLTVAASAGRAPVQPRLLQPIAYAARGFQPVAAAADGIVSAELPLSAGAAVLGVLGVYRAHPAHYTATELELLRLLAHQAALALQNGTLLSSLEHYLAELTHLLQLAQTGAASLQPADVARDATALMRSMFRAALVLLLPVAPTADAPLLGSDASPSLTVLDGFALATTFELQGLLRLEGNASEVHANDPGISGQLRGWLARHGLHTLALLPLRDGGARVGALVIGFTQPTPFTAQQWHLAEASAQIITGQMRNAQVFTATQHALRQRLAQLQQVEALVARIAHTSAAPDIFGQVLRAALNTTPAMEMAALAYRQEAGKMVVARLHAPNGDPFPMPIVAPVHSDVDTAQHLHALLPHDEADTLHTNVEVPLMQDDDVIGWLGLFSRQPSAVTPEQTAFLHTLAAHTGIALANARHEAFREEIRRMLVHDLRAPLAAMFSGLEFATHMAAEGDTVTTHETLTLVQSSAARLMRLVNTLLDVEGGTLTLQREPTALATLVSGAVRELSLAIAHRNLHIEVRLADDLPPLDVDGEKLQRVLINLLDNALSFCRQRVYITASLDASGDHAVVTLEDDGPGVPPELRERIFERQTFNGTGRQKGSHNGLGLRFCKLTVTAHGGSLWVDTSAALGGAAFTFTLPTADAVE